MPLRIKVVSLDEGWSVAQVIEQDKRKGAFHCGTATYRESGGFELRSSNFPSDAREGIVYVRGCEEESDWRPFLIRTCKVAGLAIAVAGKNQYDRNHEDQEEELAAVGVRILE